ncbi:Holliday junction DNA helicase RuvA [Candidatus Williamhamiltonella defendens]|uniref:Holliday junction branch migration complex subunit RuvA n=2 Tax=Candidatus Williamhamiltonella defendens TaxID=138072 RepID=RUVA_HAMD5|nr:Holliday junction branch migration protein RuvA [Candidatus Hamiltonella defensa]C4K7I5.1 RecName: Full=Holliday junction branch migration complex subunit RuvA [Candidatus Hamiltonella defensa 5AT (Acyrthosiphon pisum)]ACQ68528.1 Holliday junction helicase, subunit A [Candidatus Hamiltonella defensa 5AT (Acyrthosiphon pisum)]ATW23068.1 Holliday junction DNA helicase RuvA [Candidatus Hamiltonella defensa]ATW29359.1 Holliday junction DNA helicase RuvA [Candidatus Hamiltonella defensa]ATW31337
MISRMKGIILEKQPPWILLDIQGMGYDIQLPMTCFYQLPELGQEAIIFTHFVVREDAQLLYGFHHPKERAMFSELIKVNGVGPKLGLAILSGMSSEEFICALEKEDISNLIKLPGVGKKTAERLLVEMKDRIKNLNKNLFKSTADHMLSSVSTDLSAKSAEAEAISALISLGYKPQEAAQLIKNIAQPDLDSQALIKHALRSTL